MKNQYPSPICLATLFQELSKVPKRLAWILPFALILAVLAGCGGGSGASVEQLPDGSTSTTTNYSGPAPATDDVQAFKLSVWDNLVSENRCGSCHGTGDQAPTFVQSDDINSAYAETNKIVNLNNPQESLLVTKVAAGHNCWLTSDQACADTLTSYLQNWIGNIGGGSNKIELTAPIIKEPGSSKNLTDDHLDAYQTGLYPLMVQYCADCHSSSATFPQSPYFADADIEVAFEAARSRINLNIPQDSRLVVRLASEFHNCWSDCTANGNEVLEEVQTLANSIQPTSINPDYLVSKALGFNEGVPATSGGTRIENNVIAKWEFKTGSGQVAFDTSGVEPAVNLNLIGDVVWVGGYGIQIIDGKAQASTASSRKIHDLLTATNEYSIEAWVVPANVTQEGPAVIVGYGGGDTRRNFTLGQTLYNYNFLHRSSTTNLNGEPALSTPDAQEILQASLQHVVVTFSPTVGRIVYVNGERVDTAENSDPGNLNDWDNSFAFVLGSEPSGNNLWQGTIRLAAIHNRALNQSQIQTNFDAGVGEKFFLLFSTAHLLEVPDSYVVFEVSQFDSYSYLFNKPFFISLDATAIPSGIPVQGLRIGINGKEADIGQAFINLPVSELDSAFYNPDTGQELSPLGTIIAIEQGPDTDEFFLTFERIGDHTDVTLKDPAIGGSLDLILGDPKPHIGVRLFDEMNASMSKLTGIDPFSSSVRDLYLTIRQQLPAVEEPEAFVSSHQMAVTQLAIGYCDALVEDTNLRNSFFPGLNFSTPADQLFSTDAGKLLVINPLRDNFSGVGLSEQPDITGEISNLIDQLRVCSSDCSARTGSVVKAACAAVLGSAVVMVQ